MVTAWGVPTRTLAGGNMYIYILHCGNILLTIVPAWLPCDTLHQAAKSIANPLFSAVASALGYWSLPISLRNLDQDAKSDAYVCSDDTATAFRRYKVLEANTPEQNASPATPSLCACHLILGLNSRRENIDAIYHQRTWRLFQRRAWCETTNMRSNAPDRGSVPPLQINPVNCRHVVPFW